MVDTTAVLYSGLMMAVAVGMTAWRYAAAPGKVSTEVDRVLGLCLLASIALFVAAVMPDAQLPGPVFTP